MQQLSEWKDTVNFKPAYVGWYEVKHPKETWTSGQAYALWDGTTWKRALGWISQGNARAWTLDDDTGYLIVAKPLNCFQPVVPTEYRGFL